MGIMGCNREQLGAVGHPRPARVRQAMHFKAFLSTNNSKGGEKEMRARFCLQNRNDFTLIKQAQFPRLKRRGPIEAIRP